MSSYKKEIVKIKHHGREIHSVYYRPYSKKKCPIVIFSHGFNGTNIDFVMNSDYLAKNNIAALCIDFCGGSVNSKSDLNTDEMSIFTEKEDLCAVIEHVKSREDVDSTNIFLFGGSQGGLVSALVADEYVDVIKGLILLFPAFCIADDWSNRFPTLESIPDTHEIWGVQLGRIYFESIHKYYVFDHIGKFNKNVLIFHGDQDEIVGLDYGKRAALLYPHAAIEIFHGEGHGFSEAGNKKVSEMTYEFVKANR